MSRAPSVLALFALGCAGRVQSTAPDSTERPADANTEWAVDAAMDTAPACDWDAPVSESTRLHADRYLGCEFAASERPTTATCECAEGATELELDGDGARQVLRFGHRLYSCTPDRVTYYTSGGCGPDTLSACATTARDTSCLFLGQQYPYACTTLPRGHYIDREGQCWTLVRTDLTNATPMPDEGSIVAGTFEGTASLGTRTMKLRGRFRACYRRHRILCE